MIAIIRAGVRVQKRVDSLWPGRDTLKGAEGGRKGATDGLLVGGFEVHVTTEAAVAAKSAPIGAEDWSLDAAAPVIADGIDPEDATDALIASVCAVIADEATGVRVTPFPTSRPTRPRQGRQAR